MRHHCRIALLALILVFFGMHQTCLASQPDWIHQIPAAVFDRAMDTSAAGFSTDEVILRDDLRDAFLRCVAQESGHSISESQQADVLLRLLQARKAGHLQYRASRRSASLKNDVSMVAEIAARSVSDRHRITTDTILVHTKYRAELQQEAELILPGVDAYAVRKSVLRLRKRRSLKPELVLQVADWDRTVETWSLAELISRLKSDQVPHQPGIYLFRAETGYLYIGEAVDLADRLNQHTTTSDRQALADHLATAADGDVSVELHVFPRKSPAAKARMRRAYESELIRSRKPKLNVRP